VPIDSIWVKGPVGPASRLIVAAPIDAVYVTSITSFRQNPDVLLATRTYAYLRAIAAGAALLALAGLVLYLQARQRSQTIASALSRRMGLRRRDEILSLWLELAALLGFSLGLGAAIAVACALPVVVHVDLLPSYPPAPVASVPWNVAGIALGVVVVLSALAAAATTLIAGRADVARELRVA
jgi:hypothetical protein